MKLINIDKASFDNIKEDLANWLDAKLKQDIDTIFVFSSNLSDEDKKYIIKNSDYFIVDKNRIINLVENEKEKDTYELIMKVGKKYYNKLNKYPIKNMGVLNTIDTRTNFILNLVLMSLVLNLMNFLK